MFLLILAIVLAVATFIALGVKRIDYTFRWALNKRQILAVLPAPILLFGIFTQVPANSVGIQYSAFTGVRETTLSEGLHIKNLFDDVYTIPTEVQTKHLEGITGQTKDSQYVNITLDIQYKVDAANAYRVFREFRTLKNVDDQLIANVVQRAVESVTTEYNVYDILGSARNEIYAKIQDTLEADLAEKGIEFYYINFIDVDAGEAIESAITAQAVAKQAVETAEQERLKAEIEAQQRVVEAQADLEAAMIEAEIKVLEAQATADANALLEAALSDAILQKLWIEKWNGALPTVITDGSSLMMALPE